METTWYRNFKHFLSAIQDHKPDKLEVLYLYVRTKVTDVIGECADFDDAIKVINAAYIKPPNDVHSRHLLHSRIQRSDESMDEFVVALNSLASDCTFEAVTAKVFRDERVRDSFIRGLRSPATRVRLLENDSHDLAIAKQTLLHGEVSTFSAAAGSDKQEIPIAEDSSHSPMKEAVAAARSVGAKRKTFCFNCGRQRHPKDDRRSCPAKMQCVMPVANLVISLSYAKLYNLFLRSCFSIRLPCQRASFLDDYYGNSWMSIEGDT